MYIPKEEFELSRSILHIFVEKSVIRMPTKMKKPDYNASD
jgi:hypothetical protein